MQRSPVPLKEVAASTLTVRRARDCIAGQVSEGTAETNPKRRACEPEFGNGTETMFPDGYPYLLTTEASHLRNSSCNYSQPSSDQETRPGGAKGPVHASA